MQQGQVRDVLHYNILSLHYRLRSHFLDHNCSLHICNFRPTSHHSDHLPGTLWVESPRLSNYHCSHLPTSFSGDVGCFLDAQYAKRYRKGVNLHDVCICNCWIEWTQHHFDDCAFDQNNRLQKSIMCLIHRPEKRKR